MIPLRIHNLIDYVSGALLVVSPWLLGFAGVEAARTIFIIGGTAQIGYSLITKYYFSVLRVLPLGLHMTLDTILGLLLILSPALFNYRALLTEGQYAAHVMFGLGLVGIVALTRPRTEASKSTTERAAIGHDLPLTHS